MGFVRSSRAGGLHEKGMPTAKAEGEESSGCGSDVELTSPAVVRSAFCGPAVLGPVLQYFAVAYAVLRPLRTKDQPCRCQSALQ